jgi:hypothetical protein
MTRYDIDRHDNHASYHVFDVYIKTGKMLNSAPRALFNETNIVI